MDLGRHTPHNHPSHQRRPRAPASFKDMRMEEARRWKKPGGSQGSAPNLDALPGPSPEIPSFPPVFLIPLGSGGRDSRLGRKRSGPDHFGPRRQKIFFPPTGPLRRYTDSPPS